MLAKHFWKLFALLAVLLIGAAVVYSNQAGEKANENLVIEPHIKGNPEASVTLTEYSDFQCPACQQFYPVLKEVLGMHEGKIRFEYKHFPLISIHPHAVAGGRAAEAAGQQGKFFEMHDKLFENQETWSKSSNPQPFFLQYAEELGLDMDKFKTHLRSSALRDQVMAGYEEARELGLSGTPTFFLNGEQMEFATFDEFAEQVALAVNGPSSDSTGSTTDQATIEVSPATQVQFGF